MQPISELTNKLDWQVAARQVCRGERSISEVEDALFSVSAKQRTQQRAGYLLLHVHWRCPDALGPLLPRLLSLLALEYGVTVHVSIARQVFSVFQDRDVPESLAAPLFDVAITTFANRSAPTAARARALDAAANVARQYAGLWPELSACCQGVAPHEPPGIQSITRRVAAEAARAS